MSCLHSNHQKKIEGGISNYHYTETKMLSEEST